MSTINYIQKNIALLIAISYVICSGTLIVAQNLDNNIQQKPEIKTAHLSDYIDAIKASR